MIPVWTWSRRLAHRYYWYAMWNAMVTFNKDWYLGMNHQERLNWIGTYCAGGEL